MIINKNKIKKTLITIILIVLISISIFIIIKYGILLRELEKQEIAEQIEELGYYRHDFHINAERELLEHKYNLIIGIPMFITLTITIPTLIFNIFSIYEKKKEY